MSPITDNLFSITRSPNSLHVLRDSNDNNRILATGNPHGADVINAFANEGKARRKHAEKKCLKKKVLMIIILTPKHFIKVVLHTKKAQKDVVLVAKQINDVQVKNKRAAVIKNPNQNIQNKSSKY